MYKHIYVCNNNREETEHEFEGEWGEVYGKKRKGRNVIIIISKTKKQRSQPH